MEGFIGALINSIAQSMAAMFSKWFNEKMAADERLRTNFQRIFLIIFISCFVITILATWSNGQNR